MLLSRYAPDMNHVTAARTRRRCVARYLRLRRYSGVSHHGGLWFPAATGDAYCACPELRGKIDQHRWVLKMALWSLRCRGLRLKPGGL